MNEPEAFDLSYCLVDHHNNNAVAKFLVGEGKQIFLKQKISCEICLKNTLVVCNGMYCENIRNSHSIFLWLGG